VIHIFKEGELAWSPFDGLHKCFVSTDGKTIFHGLDDRYHRAYALDGRINLNDKHPTLLTVDQAALLGYYPEKKKVKKWRWVYDSSSFLEITEGHYGNEQEVINVKRGSRTIKVLQKIDSTEIEVEE
jgi:hypothetical protein